MQFKSIHKLLLLLFSVSISMATNSTISIPTTIPFTRSIMDKNQYYHFWINQCQLSAFTLSDFDDVGLGHHHNVNDDHDHNDFDLDRVPFPCLVLCLYPYPYLYLYLYLWFGLFSDPIVHIYPFCDFLRPVPINNNNDGKQYKQSMAKRNHTLNSSSFSRLNWKQIN